MAGMYPQDTIVDLFGEQVVWPGLDPETGKFTNGDFSNPLKKPSYIPADSINLVLDNISSLITKLGGTPNNRDGDQLGKAVLDYVTAQELDLTSHADMVEGMGRNLLTVLGVSTIPQAMAELRRRCNNNGEIDSSGVPDFRGLRIGDYIDGINLDGVATPPGGGVAPQAWNNTYKNNRIVIAGFNPYKGSGDIAGGDSIENTKNHVLFIFRHCIAKGRMNYQNTNAGGYPATELRTWLEDANGTGTSALCTKLKSELGGEYLLTVGRLLSNKTDWAWRKYTLFLPTEHEVFGNNALSDPLYDDGVRVPFPLYQKTATYRCKRHNGVRQWYWEGSPALAHATNFCLVNSNGYAYNHTASHIDGGVSPAFCVA